MTRDEVDLPVRCGVDGSEWHARLGPVGPRLGFVSFQRPGESVKLPRVNKAAMLRRRLQELTSAAPPLIPPRHVDIVEQQHQIKLAEDRITDYGFKCPSCGSPETLLCPTCHKFSCRGAERDAAGRIQCQWCGVTLWFREVTNDQPKAPPMEIDVTSPGTELRYRELPPGHDE